MMRWGSILFTLPAVVLLCQYGWEMSLVSDCMELGLGYDFSAQQCADLDPISQPPFYARNTLWVNGMLLVSVVGSLMMTWGMIQRGMTRGR